MSAISGGVQLLVLADIVIHEGRAPLAKTWDTWVWIVPPIADDIPEMPLS